MNYEQARAEAQQKANAIGMDYGVERNRTFGTFAVFMLPGRDNRFGHELRCEVVTSELQNHKPGHGPRGMA